MNKLFAISIFVSMLALFTLQSCGDEVTSQPDEECVTIDDSTKLCGDTQWTIY